MMIVRCIAAILAGAMVAFGLVVAVELFSSVVHPMPPDSLGTIEEMCLHVEQYPHWVLAVIVPAYAGTAFASTWIAGGLGNRICALLTGFLLIAMLVFNVTMLPYALWFKIVILLAVPVAVVLGDRWSIRRVRPDAD